MKKIILSVLVIILAICGSAEACLTNVGIASSNVYIRSTETGDIVGSLKKDEKVIVNSISKGWAMVSIGEETYKVWAQYLDVEDKACDEVKVVTKIKSSTNKTIKNKKSQKLTKNNDLYKIGKSLWD